MRETRKHRVRGERSEEYTPPGKRGRRDGLTWAKKYYRQAIAKGGWYDIYWSGNKFWLQLKGSHNLIISQVRYQAAILFMGRILWMVYFNTVI
jgi:hypothetical protein